MSGKKRMPGPTSYTGARAPLLPAPPPPLPPSPTPVIAPSTAHLVAATAAVATPPAAAAAAAAAVSAASASAAAAATAAAREGRVALHQFAQLSASETACSTSSTAGTIFLVYRWGYFLLDNQIDRTGAAGGTGRSGLRAGGAMLRGRW